MSTIESTLCVALESEAPGVAVVLVDVLDLAEITPAFW
jgi:hypothetical protein